MHDVCRTSTYVVFKVRACVCACVRITHTSKSFLFFFWAGASHKNTVRNVSSRRSLGCTTAATARQGCATCNNAHGGAATYTGENETSIIGCDERIHHVRVQCLKILFLDTPAK